MFCLMFLYCGQGFHYFCQDMGEQLLYLCFHRLCSIVYDLILVLFQQVGQCFGRSFCAHGHPLCPHRWPDGGQVGKILFCWCSLIFWSFISSYILHIMAKEAFLLFTFTSQESVTNNISM